MSFFQFEGAPCLQHCNYVFYKAFKYKLNELYRILAIGDFFFLKILQEIVCIGEIELLWEDKASNQLLASLRLYFRPEHTPEGRHDDTGEDEVIALGERLVLKLEDLVPLIQSDVKWTYGGSTQCALRGGELGSKVVQNNGDRRKEVDCVKDGCDKGKSSCPGRLGCAEGRNGVLVQDENGMSRTCTVSIVKLENQDFESDKAVSGAANVAILSYPKYCRYRAMRRRLEGCENEWLNLAIVVAIGGFAGKTPGCKVMFCKETFEQSELDTLEIRMDHMLPVLKSRPKAKKSKQLARKDSQQDSDSMEEMFANVTPSISSSSRPRRSTESSDITEEKVSTEEQAFLIGLHKFMHDAKMPIGRIPSLGFKQIDLFYFYKQAEKLGGYDSITHRRMWKHLYDKLGGNSSNTSAATCTRKHYERLLLPYERHLHKLKVIKAKKKHRYLQETDARVEQVDKDTGDTSQQESVEVKEVKQEINQEKEVKGDNPEPTIKDEVKRLNENVSNANSNESIIRKEKLVAGMTEHSKQESPVETEVLEIPVIRHCIAGNSAFPALELKSFDGAIPYSHIEQLHQQTLKSSTMSAGATVPGDNNGIPYANMMYRGGMLMLPPQMMQPPWGMVPTSNSTAPALSPHAKMDSGFFSPTGTNDPSIAALSPSSKSNQNLGHTSGALPHDSHYKAGKMFMSPQTQQPSSSGSSGPTIPKAAHVSSPYKPPPYLPNDHIQQVRGHSKSLSHHFSTNDILVNSSQNLAPILHPTPPGHRPQPHLPPAPLSIYLHPTSTNPFSPLQSPITSPPPAAHNQPRKRPYPFDNATAPATAVFPSPDIVLDRIKSSTGLPRSNAAMVHPSSIRQRFDDPRQILRQTPQSFSASQSSPSVRKQPAQQTMHSTKQDNTRLKNSSRKNVQHYPPSFPPMPPLELQQPFMHQGHTNSKVMDQLRSPNNSNGLLPSQQQSSSKTMPSPHLSSSVATSSKDGRLTSALFGTQFTALPRSTKSEHQSPAVHMPESPSALSMNSQLHPAFMSLYMQPTAQAPVPTINQPIQMLTYATPAQFAAYDEMVRQNGYGGFLAAGQMQQIKAPKKN